MSCSKLIDPADIFQNAPGIVLRVGGNSLTPRGGFVADYAVLNGLLFLTQYCANAHIKVVIVPGGVGGHIFIEWARHVGSSDAVINAIGSSLIDLGAQILADYFSRKLTKVDTSSSPKVATSIEELLLLSSMFPVVVCGSGIRGAISSDSMALLVASSMEAPVLSIKRTLPFGGISTVTNPDTQGYTHRVSLNDIEELIANDDLVGSAGWHHSVDVWAVRMLRRPDASLSFTSADSLKQFPETMRLSEVLKVIR